MRDIIELLRPVWAGILFFIPHFTTDVVACEATERGISPVISLSELEEGEEYDFVVEFRAIAFMFWAWPYKVVGEPIPWREWRE